MRVLIADLFSKDAIDQMIAEGMQVHYNDKLNGESLDKALAEHNPQVLVVRSTKVPESAINAGPGLQVIVRAGAGTDTINVAYAAKRGIYVANCPGKNANAVSELTVGLMLSIDRRMAEQNELLKQGKWRKGDFVAQKGLKDRTLGLIGFGNIAKRVCKAAIAMEMNVLVSSRSKVDGLDAEMGFKYVERDQLLQQADIVSLHCPGGDETKGLINKAFLDLMKPTGVLINTTRGSVAVDEDILAKLEANPDFWYGSDVFNNEPTAKEAEWKTDLSMHPRVYGTHHCGASTKQAEEAIGEEALRVIKKYAANGEIDLANTVNRAKKDSSMHTMSVRHLDQVGVLLHVMKVFAEHNLCIQEMQNIVFAHREASVANISFTGEGFGNDRQVIVDKLKSNENILDVAL